jgi:hypothetical protein
VLDAKLIEALQSRIASLEADCARYENARQIVAWKLDHYMVKAGHINTHPDAEKCGCSECSEVRQLLGSPSIPNSGHPPS